MARAPRLRVALFAVVLAGVAGVGCVELDTTGRPAGGQDLSQVWVEPMRMPEQRVSTTPPPQAEVAELIEQVRERGTALFAAPAPVEVYDELESVFLEAGIGLELADLYRTAVESHGAGSHLRPRMAWYYEQIGLSQTARDQAQIALENRPTDPDAHFVLGFLLWESGVDDPIVMTQIRDSFTAVFSLDPNYVGPFGVTADRLRAEAQRITEHLAE